MGTYITLEIEGITIDWSKSSAGENHGVLYQESNRKPVHADQINYTYYEANHIDPSDAEMAFVRPLSEMLPRLELMGYSIERVQREYLQAADYYLEITSDVDELIHPRRLLKFCDFCEFVREHPIESLSQEVIDYDGGSSNLKVKGRFHENPVVEALPRDSDEVRNAYSERSYFGELIGFLTPYSKLRILAECEDNLSLNVVWQYGPLVDSGWANAEDFQPGTSRSQAILIATEGSSDAFIIKKTLTLLRPDVADFFRFSDTSTHPSTGTSGLVTLAKALCQIDIINSILFVFDNDAEGCEAAEKVNALPLTANLKTMVLPDLKEFENFPTLGPDGMALSNINGRAAAIECYLDLTFDGFPAPFVSWITRKSNKKYHGALAHKESYLDSFKKLTTESLERNAYNISKLESVINAIIEQCCIISVERYDSVFNKEFYDF